MECFKFVCILWLIPASLVIWSDPDISGVLHAKCYSCTVSFGKSIMPLFHVRNSANEISAHNYTSPSYRGLISSTFQAESELNYKI